MASNEYAEQLGVNRHRLNGPNRKTFAGEIVQRYRRTTAIKMY
jgi:hypothetical protein